MPDATLDGVLRKFPASTVCDAYASTGWLPAGPPRGPSHDQGTVASDGTLTFEDLDPGEYFAHSEVSGEHRYVAFTVDPLTVAQEVDISDHTEDTTDVHGILDTSALVTGTELNEAVDGVEDLALAYVDAPPTTNVQTGAAYTPVAGDELNVIVELTNNALVTVTLPNDVFAANAQIEFDAFGTAGATFVAGSGATVNSAGGLVDLAQHSTAVARYRGGGEWLLTGALA